jgi:putative ABC transport system permease protein
MKAIGPDLAYAARTFVRDPGFTATAVLTLALGIGANLAIFSLAHAVLFRPLPYGDPERLVSIWETNPRLGVEQNHVSQPNFVDFQNSAESVAEMAAMAGWSYNLTGTGEPQKLRGFSVTPNLFQVLGVGAALGRTFDIREYADADARVVVLSHNVWRDRFGSDPEITGKTIELNDMPFVVQGVMPAGFEFPPAADVWVPVVFPDYIKEARGAHFLQVVARLKPGRTMEQAQAEMTAIAARLSAVYPGSNTDVGALVVPLRDDLAGSLQRPLWTLLAAVGFVLLIACANVGNLLSLRAVGRRRETAVRAAIGASWQRLVQQSLAESLLLAAMASIVGVFLALWSFELLRNLLPADLAGLAEPRLSAPVVALAAALTLAAGLALGMIPSLGLRRFNLLESLKTAGTLTAEGKGGRLRRLLVLAEVALACVLLVGAGLMVRTLANLYSVELGFEPHGLLTLRTELPRPRYSESPDRDVFYQQAIERVRALPGVVEAGFSSNLPLSGSGGMLSFTPEGAAPGISEQPHTNYRLITPGFLRALEIPLLAGRSFGPEDTASSPPVAVVNETMARRFWPSESPIGRRFKVGESDSRHPWVTIIGVARDAKQTRLEEESRPELFVLHSQASTSAYFTPHDLSIRTAVRPESLVAAVRAAIWEIDPKIPITGIRTMDDVVEEAAAPRRNPMVVMLCFAVLAVVLASLGIYSVVSHAVAARTREIGLRVALGATSREVVWHSLRQTLLLSVAGLALGLGAAFALSRLMASLLFGVSASDPLTFAAVAVLFLAVAAWAGFVPARRAARVDPMTALRYE